MEKYLRLTLYFGC